jgi:hypothetical protein
MPPAHGCRGGLSLVLVAAAVVTAAGSAGASQGQQLAPMGPTRLPDQPAQSTLLSTAPKAAVAGPAPRVLLEGVAFPVAGCLDNGGHVGFVRVATRDGDVDVSFDQDTVEAAMSSVMSGDTVRWHVAPRGATDTGALRCDFARIPHAEQYILLRTPRRVR